ncbi:hypothetical protein ACTOSX_13970 [Bacillus subtilis]
MSVREMLRAISELPVAAWVKRTRTAEGRFLYLIMKDEYLSRIPLAELKQWGEEERLAGVSTRTEALLYSGTAQ